MLNGPLLNHNNYTPLYVTEWFILINQELNTYIVYEIFMLINANNKHIPAGVKLAPAGCKNQLYNNILAGDRTGIMCL